MDFVSATIGVILLAICILPFILMSRGRSVKEKQMLQSLRGIAKQHNCQINQHEFCGDFVIGMDETKKFVFFTKLAKEKVIEQFIDLNCIMNCKIINSSRLISNKLEKQRIIDKLELSFAPIVRNKPEVVFEFYNSDINVQLHGELQSIEKWLKLINEKLKNKVR